MKGHMGFEWKWDEENTRWQMVPSDVDLRRVLWFTPAEREVFETSSYGVKETMIDVKKRKGEFTAAGER